MRTESKPEAGGVDTAVRPPELGASPDSDARPPDDGARPDSDASPERSGVAEFSAFAYDARTGAPAKVIRRVSGQTQMRSHKFLMVMSWGQQEVPSSIVPIPS